MPVTLQTRFWEIRASASVGSLISSSKIGRTLTSFLLFRRSALAYLILLRSKNSQNSSSVISVGTPFIARLLFLNLLVWKAFGKLTFTFLPRTAFIFVSLCEITTSCTESPITRKSPLGNSLI